MPILTSTPKRTRRPRVVTTPKPSASEARHRCTNVAKGTHSFHITNCKAEDAMVISQFIALFTADMHADSLDRFKQGFVAVAWHSGRIALVPRTPSFAH